MYEIEQAYQRNGLQMERSDVHDMIREGNEEYSRYLGIVHKTEDSASELSRALLGKNVELEAGNVKLKVEDICLNFSPDSTFPVMEGVSNNFHHDLMFFLTFILFFVLVGLGRTLYYFQYSSTNNDIQSRSVVHGTLIELIWTIVPSLVLNLIIVALPSFALLYFVSDFGSYIAPEGVFYGQRSEICGVGHTNIPIVIESI